jgi:hypothetical protein
VEEKPFSADLEGPAEDCPCDIGVLGIVVDTGVVATLLVDLAVRVEAIEAVLVREVGTSGVRGLDTGGNLELLAIGRTDAELFLPLDMEVGVVGLERVGVAEVVRTGVTALEVLLLATPLAPLSSFSFMFKVLVLASEPRETSGLIPPLIVPLLTTPAPLLSSVAGSPVRLGTLLPSEVD